jgi:hypothetical protein
MTISVSAGHGLIDRLTTAAVEVPYEHHEIHDGDMFVASHYVESVADGNYVRLCFKTGAKYAHVYASFYASALAFARVREAPAYTDNTGSPKAVYNHNRSSAKTSTVIDISQNPDVANQATTDPTLTSAGTILIEEVLGGGNRSGSASRSEEEFVLAPNTFYCFEVESGAAGTTCGVVLNWYEKGGS